MTPETRYGLIAVDKQGSNVLFLNPETFAVEQELNAFPPRPHELLILPDQHKAYVSIFGDGVHGNNPHPGHKIAVIDLFTRQVTGFIDIRPFSAPHTARLGRDGYVYQSCENSGVVLVIDPATDKIVGKIDLPSHNSHRLTILPSGRKLFTENEEDASVTVLELHAGQGKVVDNVAMPGAINGIAASPGHPYIVATDSRQPLLYVLDAQSHQLRQTLSLPGHQKACQIVRYSDDGSLLVAVGNGEPVISLFDGDLKPLGEVKVGNKPMDGCFSPDNRTLLIANEDDGTLSVIDIASLRVVATPSVGRGCEVLSYFELPD
ncbi:WD40 repeat domain-containing protein [Erwinia sp. P6884]|uniref:WD40 repeat domain-containing protein n=1 Tax=Erwinia sp. P6884 TaxID=3141450 RepID=UPI0031861A50